MLGFLTFDFVFCIFFTKQWILQSGSGYGAPSRIGDRPLGPDRLD